MNRIDHLTEVLERINKEGLTKELREQALEIVRNVDPLELSLAEQKLIDNGLDPVDLRHLCDVHMEVLEGELKKTAEEAMSGHIVNTLMAEHEKLLGFLTELDSLNLKIQKEKAYKPDSPLYPRLLQLAESILDAENHHQREERVLFPEMERRGITGPTRVMRMEHDNLRLRKHALKELAENIQEMDFEDFKNSTDQTAKYIIFNLRDHIFKENHILYPAGLKAITDENIWKQMKIECDKIGYCSFTPEELK